MTWEMVIDTLFDFSWFSFLRTVVLTLGLWTMFRAAKNIRYDKAFLKRRELKQQWIYFGLGVCSIIAYILLFLVELMVALREIIQST